MKLNSLGRLGNKLLSSIFISAIVIIVFVILVTFYLRYALDLNIEGQRALDKIEVASNNVYQSLIDEETGQRGYSITNDDIFLEPYYKGKDLFTASAEDLLLRTKHFPELYKEAQTVIEIGHFWERNYAIPFIELASKGEKPSNHSFYNAKITLDSFRVVSKDFTKKIDDERTIVRNTMRKRINGTLISLVVIVSLVILTNIWINFRILKAVIKPIISLNNCVKAYTEHDFSREVPSYNKQDELFDLIKNVDIMRSELSLNISNLESKVNKDALTGLYNRRYFNELIVTKWQQAKDKGDYLSVILFDIDHYKKFNDTYGHLIGDKCLTDIGDCLQTFHNEPFSYVARYGGEEFVVLLRQQNEKASLEFAEKIRLAIVNLKIPHRTSPTSDYVTVSVGVGSVIPTDEIQLTELITMADQALYDAKGNGRNQVSQLIVS